MDKDAQRGLNMHKLILSITAVALLQIGFITYITQDQTVDNTRFAANDRQPVSPTSTLDHSSEHESIEVASLDEDPFFKPDAGNFGSVRTASVVRAGYGVRRKNTRVARKPKAVVTPFEPEEIIITYAVQKPYKFIEREPYRNISAYNEPIVNKPELTEQPVQKAEKSDGNAFLNVIKRPFGWIKALGSKLK